MSTHRSSSPRTDVVGYPATPLLVESLPGQLAAEVPLDLLLLAEHPIEDPLIRLGLLRSPVDVQLDPALSLADHVLNVRPRMPERR